MFDLLGKVFERKVLRPHQVRALDQLYAAVSMTTRRVIIQLPTGGGKTLIASRIIERALAKGNRVIFTAPAISLIDQTVSGFEAEGVTDIGVMQANHPRTDEAAAVQVASVQTLARRDIPSAALVIVDEAHIRSQVIETLMTERPDLFFIGLTATPWAKGMGRWWQDLVVPATVGDLIEAGYLSKFTVYAPYTPDMSGVKTRGGDFREEDAEAVMRGEAIMASVVDNWLARGENRPTLVFGVNRAHAAAMHEGFTRAGVASAYVDAFTDRVERQWIEKKFRAGEIKVACSVRTLTTGVDWPVSCIVDAAPTKSEILHMQKIGRGLRINPGTEDLVVFDHAGNSLRVGLVTDIHHEHLDRTKPGERQKRTPTEKLPKECANCGALHTGLTCPFCGHERKPPPGMEVVDGELVRIAGKKAAPTSEQKQAFWSMALWMANERQYSRGWASHKYRDKFGVWPRGLSDIPKAPDQAFLNWEKSRRIAWAKAKAKKEEQHVS